MNGDFSVYERRSQSWLDHGNTLRVRLAASGVAPWAEELLEDALRASVEATARKGTAA